MQVEIHPTPESGSARAAEQIRGRLVEGFRLGVATGSTPLAVYAQLRDAHRRGELTLAGATAWALDEYVGLPRDHPQAYRNVLHAELVADDATGLSDARLHAPDGAHHDPRAAAREYEQAIGTGVDLQILGLGANGHIGFNEPIGSLRSQTHVGRLTPRTRQDNSRFFDDDIDQVPRECITQGLATIMRAHEIVLLAWGEHKAEAVAQMVEGPISARWPATVLQQHPRVWVYLDTASARDLTLTELYHHASA